MRRVAVIALDKDSSGEKKVGAIRADLLAAGAARVKRGLPKAGKYVLTAWPGDFSGYIPGGREIGGGVEMIL